MTEAGPVGAHVSVAGGSPTCGPRAMAIGADAIQIFTKNANQWRERTVEQDEAKEFRAAIKESGARFVTSHDSYLMWDPLESTCRHASLSIL